jgi:pilus assembly protein CpaC
MKKSIVVFCLLALSAEALAQAPAKPAPGAPAKAAAAPPAAPTAAAPAPLSQEPARKGPDLRLSVGKSSLLRLPEPIERVSVANPAVADVTAISARELYLLGKDMGMTNVIVWSKGGQATVIDVTVASEPKLLESEIASLLPGGNQVKVHSTADSIVLTGTVDDAETATQAVEIARAWVRRLTRGIVMPVSGGDGKGGTNITVGETRNVAQTAQVAGPIVINMLRVRAPMQVMLEVKVAEISKTLLSRLGVTVNQVGTAGRTTFNLLSRSNFLAQLLGSATIARPSGDALSIDAQTNDGLIKVLAEPNIMAISGQEASFRAGGKIFIPVSRRNDVTGGATITLEEKEFGVGLQFLPRVLAGGLISLRVAPEVSELQQAGNPFLSDNGVVSVLPSFTLRRAETTVQLHDGQSFMIAGLIQNKATSTLNRFPGLGDIPVLGALFRSTEFQNDKTELMFVITPRLVKPLPADAALPTDGYVEPSLPDFHLGGQMEGAPRGAAKGETKSGFATK